MRAERNFHYALATVFVPILLLPLTWALALRVPSRRTLALALFDTAMWSALVLMLVTSGIDITGPLGPPRIGVQLDSGWDGPGARVESVWRDSPAERGGLLSDDVIVAIDDEPVSDWEALTEEIGVGADRAPRKLAVRRAEHELTLTVLPEVGLMVEAEVAPLFEPESGVECRDAWKAQTLAGLMPIGIGLGAILLLWLWAWRRAPEGRHRWVAVVVPLALAPLIGAGTAHVACVSIGGWSIGVMMLGLVAQGLALLCFGVLIMRLLRGELALVVGPKLSTARASRTAVFYIVTGLLRVLITLGVLWTLFPQLEQGQDQAISVLFDRLRGPLGRGLLVLAAVILAPLAEEVIFRGVLLPGLARQMRPGVALVLSAALFALFHVPSHGVGAVVPGMLGVVFGWARLRTGNLVAPIALHAANNLLVTLLAWGL
jgi:membrane protease YdiL (CAAX protease family)